MHQFISRLIRRNHELLSEDSSDTDARALLTTQAIAQNALHRLALYKDTDATPPQIVVVGPTQAGKSTVVNILLQQHLAEASAQAGFTVHCQGFHIVRQLQDHSTGPDAPIAKYFGDLQQAPLEALDRQVLSEYSLQETLNPDSPLVDTVVWDTPDFDSIRSFDYRAPLIKALALADLVVFVVSKDKYADKTVWMVLDLLESLNTLHVILMNKTCLLHTSPSPRDSSASRMPSYA